MGMRAATLVLGGGHGGSWFVWGKMIVSERLIYERERENAGENVKER